jgi:hypothetical protein
MLSRVLVVIVATLFLTSALAAPTKPTPAESMPTDAELADLVREALEAPTSPPENPVMVAPTWTELHGTTFEFVQQAWRAKAQDGEHRRIFGIQDLDSGAVIAFHEVALDPQGASAEDLLRDAEATQRAVMATYEPAPSDAATHGLEPPAGATCRHLRAQRPDELPTLQSHCVIVAQRHWTYVTVLTPPDVAPAAIARLNGVLRTVRARAGDPPREFSTRPLADVVPAPPGFGLRLPVRFDLTEPSGKGFRRFCDGADEQALGDPVRSFDRRTMCVTVGAGPASPDDRANLERALLSSERFRSREVSRQPRTIHGVPAVEITLAGELEATHLLMVEATGQTLLFIVDEPLGPGTEGYDAIWRELVEGL